MEKKIPPTLQWTESVKKIDTFNPQTAFAKGCPASGLSPQALQKNRTPLESPIATH
jgi:hypothetical protein